MESRVATMPISKLQDPKFAAATRRLIRVVRAGIAAGAAPAMLTALLAEEADQ